MAHLTSVGSGIDDAGSTTYASDAITISGTDKVLYVMAFSSDGSPVTPSGVVLDSAGVNESLTKIDEQLHGTFGYASIWRRIAPSDVTAKVVTITWASSQSERGAVCWVETGIDQTTPNGAITKTNDTSSSAISSGAVTTTTGDRVLNFAHAIDTGTFAGAGVFTSPSGTERIDGAISGTIYDVFAAQEQTASGASTNPSWTLSETPTGWVSFAFKVNNAASGSGGALSSSGSGTTNFTGASRTASAVSSIGVGAANFTGRALISSAISMAGVGAANFAGRSVVAGRFTAAAVATANFVGAGRGAGALSITGIATANFNASSRAAGALNSVGAGTVNLTASSVSAGSLSSAGAATANFVGAVAADGQGALYIVGAGTAAFSGSARSAAALSVAGVGAANLTGGAINRAPLSITGVSTVSFVGAEGANTVGGAWSTSGQGQANFGASSRAAGDIAISGSGSASFVGDGGIEIQPEVIPVPDASNAGGGGNSWEIHRKGRRKKIAAQDAADIEALLAFLEQAA